MSEKHMDDVRDAAVLIVDDTPANIGVLRNMLQTEGYQIFAATSGEAALKIVQQTPPDLILLDVMMPGIDGFETCRRLKANEETRDIPVIFVTAKIEPQDIVDGFQAGAVDYLSKPVRHEEVCIRVRTQLKIRKLHQTQREQNERFRAIVNNMAEGLLILEADSRIQFVNPMCLNMLGYSEQQLLGRSFGELLLEPYQHAYQIHFFPDNAAHSSREGLPSGPKEVAVLRQNGEPLCLDLTLTALFLQQTFYIALLHDITQHKQSEQNLQSIANIDPLTNIANRRHFNSVLEEEWKRALRSGAPLSLVVFDVDQFKRYNDALGHQAGDRCLQAVAHTLKEQVNRVSDLAARYGGEEFVLLLANTDLTQATMMAETTRMAIEALQLVHPNASTGPWVTVSGGVACTYAQHGMPAEHLFAMADAALYRAKEDGRNRIYTTEMSGKT